LFFGLSLSGFLFSHPENLPGLVDIDDFFFDQVLGQDVQLVLMIS